MIKGSIQIPFYEPEKNELSPRAWLQIIELARTSAGKHKVKTTNDLGAEVEVEEWVWQDEQMTTNAILLMRGSASKWAEILLEKQVPELKSWSGFTPQIIKTYRLKLNGQRHDIYHFDP